MYNSEKQAKEDWQSIAPKYRTKERLDEIMKHVRHTATTIECVICGNTDPNKFSVITGGYRATRFQGKPAKEPGGMVLNGSRCLVCARLTGRLASRWGK